MASFNKVILMGNLTRDPELRYTPSNQPVVKIGMAVNRRYTTASGEKREEVTFVDCEAWGRTAETINQYMSKGRPLLVEGRLRLDQWTDQQGQKRSKLLVVIENFQFVGAREGGAGAAPRQDQQSPGESSSSGDYSSPGGGTPSPASDAAAGSTGGHDPISEDDIPF